MGLSASIIFCDDIRIEANGKHILVGVYLANLVPAALPQSLALSIWVRLRGLVAGVHNVSFKVTANGVTQVEADVSITVQDGDALSHMSLIGLPIHLTHQGKITFSLSGLPGGETLHEELPVASNAASGSVAGSYA